MDSPSRTSFPLQRIKVAVFLFAVVIAIGAITFVFSHSFFKGSVNTEELPEETGAPVAFEDMPPLLPVSEAELQQQINKILIEGEESDCETLADPRYQFACHDFFKLKKQ